MKTKIIILNIFFIVSCSLSQNWVNNYDFQSSYSGYNLVQIQFLNPNTGWVSLRNSSGNVKMLKTVNKGRNWSEINSFNMYGFTSARPFFVFIDANVGYRAHSINEGSLRTILDKTVDGGNSWTRKINYITIEGELPLITFKNTTEGYLYIADMYSGQNTVKVYRTYDGFETSSEIYEQGTVYQRNFLLNDIFIDANQTIHAVGRNKYLSLGTYDFYRLSYGSNFLPSYGSAPNNTDLHFLYGANFNTDLRYLGVERNINNDYPGTRFYTDVYSQNSILIDEQREPNRVGGFSFSNSSKGFVTVDNKIYITNNSGNSWQQEATLVSSVNSSWGHHRVKSFSDVCYAVSDPGKFHTREISGNYNTNYDWSVSSPGSIAVDGENKSTPSTGYYRGGGTLLYANPYIISGNDTTARFYYWGGDCNGSMNYDNNNSYIINSNSNINADYKTKLRSNTSDAIKNANQVKILKDTNGVTNIVYESMGGIFFTRTKPDGNFKIDEILSGTYGSSQYGNVTYSNSNPYLTEFKPYQNTAANSPEKNVWACWERREGNNIKILVAARSVDPLNRPEWYVQEYATIENAPLDFKCFPKIIVAGNLIYNTRVLTYLKPLSGSSRKLVGKIFYNSNPNIQERDIIPASNIQEYAIAPISNNGLDGSTVFNVHLSYRTVETNNQQPVFYKHVKIGWDELVQGPFFYEVPNTLTQVSNDISRWRASVDIALKNASDNTNSYSMQPVVTYQGRYDVRIIIQNEDGPPQEVPGSYYPVYVRERLQGGQWSSSSILYNSLNNVQQTPNIEGSKQRNSCLLNYTRIEGGANKNLQVVPRWNNSAPNAYFCVPNYFTGTDAKLQKGGLVSVSSTSHKLATLSQSGSVYNIGAQNFNVTNEQSTNDGGSYDAISGTVVDEGVKYSFNLGNIMVNWNLIGFSSDIDTTIEDTPDFNEGMKSEVFPLNENDTLIIGRNAFYILESGDGEPLEIEYKVKLMNKSTEIMHRLLAQDTIHAGDTVQVEFLEGYIIRDIPNGTDSFYVQMEIDTLDGSYGIGGGSGDGPVGGDSPNSGIKRKIFWENEKPNMKTSTIPTKFNLYQNFPNPFNPVTKIKYDLPTNSNVTITIYDLLGREVTRLVNNELRNAGRYEIEWNANKYASGAYIYRIEAGDFVDTKKMILIK